MSTVTNMISAGVSSVTGTNQVVGKAASNSFTKLSEELQQVQESTSLTDEEKEAKLAEINKKISDVASAQSTSLNAGGSLMNSMFGSGGSSDGADMSFFFSGGYTISNVKSLYSASKTIEKEARVLSSEIALDKARGRDTSDKAKKLSNLTENVNILNKNLSKQIESALADKEADSETLSVIGKIKAELEENQKKLDKEFGNVSSSEQQAEASDKQTAAAESE